MLKIQGQFGWCAVAVAVLAAGRLECPAQTPPTANPPAFSEPADSEIASPENNDNLPIANPSQPASQLFRMGPPESLGTPTPDLNPAWQKQEQERSEWSLQTPEEIMGLQTPRQMFGLPDADENLSPEERYLHRRDQAKVTAAQSSLSQPGALNHDFSARFDRADRVDSTLAPGDQDDAASFSRMFKDASPSSFGPGKSSLPGDKPLDVENAAQLAKAQQDQAADMARFRSLIGEAPASPDPNSTLPHEQVESGQQPPASSEFDTFGRPAPIHTEDLSKPTGLSLTPEIAGYDTAVPSKPKKPSWEPQAAPWLSDSSGIPDKPPVRKFY